MGEYSKFISEKRRAVDTPKSIVKPDGGCEFGTFKSEFEQMDFVKLNGPTALPNMFNRLKLTLWEATEVNLKNGVLLAAVCDMAIFGKVMNMFYDKRTKKVYTWETNLPSKDTHISANLINGAVTEAQTEFGYCKFINNFQNGECTVEGAHKGKCLITTPRKDKTAVEAIKENYGEATIEYSFKYKRLSDPCVVSIPFDTVRPRPLYSQKDFFKCEGKLIINGEVMMSDEDTVSIVDDHRGFYPRHAHYDWVTTMGRCNIDGEQKLLAFNLTRNQSIDQEKYNENILWLEGKSSLLPPVTFTYTTKVVDFKDYAEVIVKDEHDMVNLKYKIYGLNPMILHALVVNIDYYVTYGELEGYVRDEDGKKYILDGMQGIGEDKTLLL